MSAIRRLTVFKDGTEIASNLTTIQAAELAGIATGTVERYYEEERTTRSGYRFEGTNKIYEKTGTRKPELLRLYEEWDEVRQQFVR